MAKKCSVCGKQKVFGKKVSFSNRKSSRSWAPNIRSVRAIINGAPKKIDVCARCLKSGRVERAI